MLFFQYPLWLLGLLLVPLPFLLRFARRLPREEVPFSAVIFLQPSEERRTLQARFQFSWLALLRALTLFFLVLAMSEPSLVYHPAARVRRFSLVVENAPRGIEEARELATAWAQALPATAEGSLVLFCGPPARATAGRLPSLLARVESCPRSSPYLAPAAQGPSLFVFSSFRRASFQGFRPGRKTWLVPLSAKDPLVFAHAPRPRIRALAGETLSYTFELYSFAEEPTTVDLEFFLAGRVVKRQRLSLIGSRQVSVSRAIEEPGTYTLQLRVAAGEEKAQAAVEITVAKELRVDFLLDEGRDAWGLPFLYALNPSYPERDEPGVQVRRFRPASHEAGADVVVVAASEIGDLQRLPALPSLLVLHPEVDPQVYHRLLGGDAALERFATFPAPKTVARVTPDPLTETLSLHAAFHPGELASSGFFRTRTDDRLLVYETADAALFRQGNTIVWNLPLAPYSDAHLRPSFFLLVREIIFGLFRGDAYLPFYPEAFDPRSELPSLQKHPGVEVLPPDTIRRARPSLFLGEVCLLLSALFFSAEGLWWLKIRSARKRAVAARRDKKGRVV